MPEGSGASGGEVMSAQSTRRNPEPSIIGSPLTWRRLANVIEEIGFCEPISLHRFAQRLAMSPRTLQRRLREEGLTHRCVMALVRRERAFTLLSSDAKLDDVAGRLGFCSAGAFHRAFKRWTGVTPGAFKRAGGQRRTPSCAGLTAAADPEATA
jgi:AraC-like DNA-binding protein